MQWGYRDFYFVDWAACPGEHTLTVYVTYNGATTSESHTYNVTGEGTVWSNAAWTADGSGTGKRVFNAGDSIRWYGNLLNSTVTTQTVDSQLTRTTPCGTTTLWDDTDDVAPGYTGWYYSGKAACPGAQQLTYSVTYDGVTTSESYNYTVRGSGSVSANDADASDTNGDAQTTFAADDTIRWYGQIFNSTNATKTYTAKWHLRTPCSSSYLWQGSLTEAPGYSWRYVSGTASCPGTHTLTFSVVYAGRTTTKTYTYTVTGNGSVESRSAWIANSTGATKTSIRAGDPIRFYGKVFNTGPTQPFTATFSIDSPCGESTEWQGSLSANRGSYTTYYLSRTAACPGDHTLTFSATYSGTTTSTTRDYAVTGTGNVTASSARSADDSGTTKTTFTVGEGMRWYGYSFNSTSADQASTARFHLKTPCSSGNLAQASVTAETGYDGWYVSGTAACAGRHTLTFYVTYNGRTTSKTASYTVRAATAPVAGGSGSPLDRIPAVAPPAPAGNGLAAAPDLHDLAEVRARLALE